MALRSALLFEGKEHQNRELSRRRTLKIQNKLLHLLAAAEEKHAQTPISALCHLIHIVILFQGDPFRQSSVEL
jgi:hypothetical protein